MATKFQIAEQVALERECISCGIAKLHKDIRKTEEREYASSNIIGVASISAAQEAMGQAIMERFAYLKQRHVGKALKLVNQYLIQFNDPEQAQCLANIALKRTFDTVFSRKRKDGNKYPNTLTQVLLNIGQAVETECQMRWYESQSPDLYRKIKDRYWLSTTGTKQKASVMSLLMNREKFKWRTWSTDERIRVGDFLLTILTEVTGWFDKETTYHGNPKLDIVVPSELYLKHQGRLLQEAELFAPLAYPMLIEPNDWTNERPGGYLLNEVQRGHELVRRGKRTILQPEIPLNFLNRLQKVAYRINPFVYEVAKTLEERGHKLESFKPLSFASNWHIPNKPLDIETNEEARKKYKKERTEAENAKKKYERSMHVKTTATLDVATKFKDKDEFFLPWSFDYRGRAYPIPSYLTPHDTDFGKSLLRAAHESFMTHEAEDWLAFQVATTYGLDKKSMADRLEWTRNNFTLISAVANDPIGNLSIWENADEPWQFLAACDEYYHCVINCSRHTTGLFVAVDATCSGLQILAGLARDKGTAALVNVLPSDKPQDAYRSVLEAMEDIPPRLSEWMDRGVTKRSVMTIPYNATMQSSRDYIRDALHDNMPKDASGRLLVDKVSAKEATILAQSLRNALNKIAPGCLAVRDWIGKEMAACIKRGNEVVEWVTPSGFHVHQRRDHFKTKRINLAVYGGVKLNIIDEELGPNPRKHKSSGAPNVIHSLDSALLHLTFQRFDVPFTVIHDSVLCRATDMSCLNSLVRETYMNMFAEHDYLTDFAQQIGAETEPPIIGDLEPSSVIESTYFFC